MISAATALIGAASVALAGLSTAAHLPANQHMSKLSPLERFSQKNRDLASDMSRAPKQNNAA